MMQPPVSRAWEPEKCYRCQGIDVVTDYSTGDVVCRGCGEVQCQRIADSSAEWRSFDDDTSGDRVGGELDSLSTRIFGTGGGGGGSQKRKRTGRYEATGESLMNKRTKSGDKLKGIAIMIMTEVRTQNLSDEVKNVALRLLDEAWETGENGGVAFRGVDEKVFTAAVLYLACKHCDVVKTIGEFAKIFRLNKFDIGKMINKITDKIKDIGNAVFSPDQVVDRHAGQLSLSPHLTQVAIETIQKAREVEGMGAIQPQTLSGAVLLLVLMVQKRPFLTGLKAEDGQQQTEEPKMVTTVAEVAEVTMVSLQALKRAHNILFEKRHIVLPEAYQNELAAKGMEPMKASNF